MFKKIFLAFFILFNLLIGLFLFSGAANAQSNPSPSEAINAGLPCIGGVDYGLGGCSGSISTSTEIVDYIIRFYQFGIGIVGIIAVGMIIAGGIYISVSGSVDKKGEGKDMIKSAILGIVLLFGSYIILKTINPELVKLSPPKMEKFDVKKAGLTENISSALCGSVGPTKKSYKLGQIKIEVPHVPGRDGYCKYRKVITDDVVEISNDGKYYDENETIPKRSTVWSYPYYIKNKDPQLTAACLVYAYRPSDEEKDSSVTFIDLNTNLGVCVLEDSQDLKTQGEIQTSGKCSVWSLSALKYSYNLLGNLTPDIQTFGPINAGDSFPYYDASKPPEKSVIPDSIKKQLGDYEPIGWNCIRTVKDSDIAQCDSIDSCAALFGTNPKPRYESDALKEFMNKLINDKNGLGKLNGIPIFNLFNHSTYDVSAPTCNKTHGKPTLANTKCSHSPNSCHYGGATGDGAAMAIDIGSLSGSSRDNWSKYCDIARSWGLYCSKLGAFGETSLSLNEMKGVVWDEILKKSKNFNNGAYASCENNGTRVNDCSKANHVHVSISPCKG